MLCPTHPTSIFIGAPRATSYLPDQRNITEPGAIYRCPLADLRTASTATCAPYTFDAAGNQPPTADKYVYKGELHDRQWLGASMAGGSLDSDRLIVCAPRMYTHQSSSSGTIELNPGLCYWTPGTGDADQPQIVQTINALTLRSQRVINDNGDDIYHHMLGEQGISVHVTDDGREMLIGAPGVSNWRGTVVRTREENHFDGGIARRDVAAPKRGRRHESQSDVQYEDDVPNPLHADLGAKLQENAYFGYAVASGAAFLGPANRTVLYVASAPQSNDQQGEVFVFDITSSGGVKHIREYQRLAAGQMGEYFGYALAADDFDGDGWTDLVVAAPFHSAGDTHDNGAVYVYGNVDGRLVLRRRLRTEYAGDGRFGMTVARLGDVNGDGYADLAVGAPYEANGGAVYVYLGGADGLGEQWSQRLAAPASVTGRPGGIFGHGLSRGVDVDGNRYPDLAVGAPEAGAVFVYRAYPVARIRAHIRPLTGEIADVNGAIDFRACWRLERPRSTVVLASSGSGATVEELATETADGQLTPTIDFDIRMDALHGRVTTTDPAARTTIAFAAVATEREQCREYRVNARYVPDLVFRPMVLDMHYEVRKADRMPEEGAEGAEVFCERCVAVDPREPRAVQAKVVFSTRCKGTRCVADLKLSSVVREP